VCMCVCVCIVKMKAMNIFIFKNMSTVLSCHQYWREGNYLPSYFDTVGWVTGRVSSL